MATAGTALSLKPLCAVFNRFGAGALMSNTSPLEVKNCVCARVRDRCVELPADDPGLESLKEGKLSACVFGEPRGGHLETSRRLDGFGISCGAPGSLELVMFGISSGGRG